MAGKRSIAEVLEGIGVPPRARLKIEDGLDAAGVCTEDGLNKATPMTLKPYLAPGAIRFLLQGGYLVGAWAREICEASKIGEKIVALSAEDVDFGQVRVFTGIPWPSLEDPPNRIKVEDGLVQGLIGRGSFTRLKEFYLSGGRRMEYDGVIGGGKSHNLIMLTIWLFREFSRETEGVKRKRVISLLTHETPLKTRLQNALLLSFWDDEVMQRLISGVSGVEDIYLLLREASRNNDLIFIIDGWNDLEKNPGDCAYVRDLICETRSVALKGGSPRQDSARRRHEKGNYNAQHKPEDSGFDDVELRCYLSMRRGDSMDTLYNADDERLLYYTGKLPLHVSVWVSCMEQTSGDVKAAAALFCSNRDIAAMELGFVESVRGLGGRPEPVVRSDLSSYTRIVAGRGSTMDSYLVDPRWLVRNENGYYGLVSDYARDLLMQHIQTHQKSLLAVVGDELAERVMDECSSCHPNTSLLGWLVEKLVLYVAMRAPIGVGDFGKDLRPEDIVVSYFNGKGPGAYSTRPTLYVPLLWRFPHIDFCFRMLVNEKKTVGGAEVVVEKLKVWVYQVSLGLQAGSDHWQSCSKFLDVENRVHFTGNFNNLENVDWTFSWIGRQHHAPHWAKNGCWRTPASIILPPYTEQWFDLGEVASAFSGSMSAKITSIVHSQLMDSYERDLLREAGICTWTDPTFFS